MKTVRKQYKQLFSRSLSVLKVSPVSACYRFHRINSPHKTGNKFVPLFQWYKPYKRFTLSRLLSLLFKYSLAFKSVLFLVLSIQYCTNISPLSKLACKTRLYPSSKYSLALLYSLVCPLLSLYPVLWSRCFPPRFRFPLQAFHTVLYLPLFSLRLANVFPLLNVPGTTCKVFKVLSARRSLLPRTVSTAPFQGDIPCQRRHNIIRGYPLSSVFQKKD